jgi:hypothetical protein
MWPDTEPERSSCPASPTSTSQHDALPPGQVLSIALPVGRGSGDGIGSCGECRAQPGVKEQLDLVDCAVLRHMAEHLVVHVLKPGHWIFRKPLARNTVANQLTESHADPITTRLQSRSYGDRGSRDQLGQPVTGRPSFDAVSNRAVAVRGEGGGWPQSAIPAEEEK